MSNFLTEKIERFRGNLNLRRTLTLVWSVTRGWAILTIILIFAETALFFASVYVLKLLINAVSASGFDVAEHQQVVLRYVVLAALCGIAYFVVKSFSAYVTGVQASKVSLHMDDRIHATAAQLDYPYFESPDYFDILKRAKDAGSDKPHLVIVTLIEIAKNAMSLLGVGLVLVTISWYLLPILALFVLPTLLVRIHFANKLNQWRVSHTATERQAAYLSDLITSDVAAKEIRVFSLGQYFKDQYLRIKLELQSKRLKLNLKSTQREVITMAMASLGFFTCVGFIAMEAVNGKTSVGDVTIFLVVFPQSFTIMQNLAAGISIVYQNSLFVNSIFDLFGLQNKADDDGLAVEQNSGRAKGLELKNISFSYPHTDKVVLKDISINVPPGKMVAVVGLNGAGKSTLIKLICRLYDPTSGAIAYGGTDIRSFKASAYRKQIGIVFQDLQHYNVSVADNIRFGDLDKPCDLTELKLAAQKAGADVFIDKLPEGYETIMGRLFDKGQEVSIGQWQKIGIARAFYSSANILVFDEATSAMDTVSEKELLDKFRAALDDRAAVVISHRHSAVKYADHIYVLSGGRVIEQGTDEELLNAGGEYARLFKNIDE
ncbi:ABC transporter ATP-binding protein [Mucilaginibacter myungsuensis]|uniref:ABC transporter ATP-binding protein n=1 Tax=Mucilaginibacter myungsuensis TaxID=649104 RepID=A0A929L506_9SPHI|nr:ABC transporter ATP-binding protein [Mucilaginibacter myungsuensis]MBE9664125.1 ABC transporter ATP-binding protein [Mucilaginibacter myungsuensis]MDN3601304.1 ABC transporter ATP-binding protein [Mucilaginibacter myungsuensis]